MLTHRLVPWVLFVLVMADVWAEQDYFRSHGRSRFAMPQPFTVNLGPVVRMARRLGADGLYDNWRDLQHSVKFNFMRVYYRQINSSRFLTYPEAADVSRRILEICRAYLQISQSVGSLTSYCSPTRGSGDPVNGHGAAVANSQTAKRIRASSRRLEKTFKGMFREVDRPAGARLFAEQNLHTKIPIGDYCAQVELLAAATAVLRQRLIGYFFDAEASTVSVQQLYLPSISSLTSVIRDTAKQIK